MRRTSESTRNRIAVLSALQIMLGMLLAPAAAFPASVTLGWDPSTTAEVAGYKVYYQANSGEAPLQGTGAAEGSAPIDVAKNLSATLTGLDPANSYFFAVTAYNEAGVESGYSNVIEMPEALPPLVAISSPASGAPVTGAVTIVATASDNKGVARVEFYVNGALKETDTQAPYSYSWDTSPLAGGEYTVSAKAFDAAGNAGEAAISLVVAGDTVNPEVFLTEPGNNSAVTGNVQITATASDNTALSRIEFFADGALVFASNQSPASYSWNSLSEPNGNHVLTARAHDAAGNVGESLVVVKVANDLLPPAVSLLSPASGAHFGNATSAGGVVEVTAAASDDTGVTRVEFYLNGALQRTATAPPYGFTWDSSKAASGPYTLSAKAFDASGKGGESAAVAVTVSNDATAPVAAITAPAGGPLQGEVTVVVAASDNIAVGKVEIYLDGALKTTLYAAPYSLTLDTRQLANGAHTMSAKAYDAAGNSGDSGSVTLNVFNDRSAPLVSIANPLHNSTAGGVVALSATASDDVAVEKVEIYLDGMLKTSLYAAPYSLTLDTRQLANGAHTVSARAYDAAGNSAASGSVTLNVFNDNFPPAITSFSMPAATTSTTVGVTAFSAMDNVGVTGYLITESSTVPFLDAPEWSATAPTSFTFSATGIRTAYAWARDAAGQVSPAGTATVVVDTVLPLISSMTFSGSASAVTVNASGTDNIAVAKMELYIDDTLQLETEQSSLSYVCAATLSRSQKVTVKVYDLAGNMRLRTMRISKF